MPRGSDVLDRSGKAAVPRRGAQGAVAATAQTRALAPHPMIGRACASFVATYLQGQARLSGGDFVDAVIRMAILDANARYDLAGQEADGRTRASSIHSIALSLGLPYETVRRRTRGLAAKALCSIVAGGVLITDEQRTPAPFERLDHLACEAICQLYANLREVYDPFQTSERPGAASNASKAPVRQVSNAARAYVLRYLESAEQVTGSLLDGIVFVFTVFSNVENLLTPSSPDFRSAAKGNVVGDALRRRVAAYALARNMGLPSETVRRRLKGLTARGLVVGDAGGYYVPAAVLTSPPLMAHRDRNLASLQRLSIELQRVGFGGSGDSWKRGGSFVHALQVTSKAVTNPPADRLFNSRLAS